MVNPACTYHPAENLTLIHYKLRFPEAEEIATKTLLCLSAVISGWCAKGSFVV
jgi:hypothetical protein